nr:helix-turn-helix transcriptional regulator [Thiorhodovibrio winogradskyi]
MLTLARTQINKLPPSKSRGLISVIPPTPPFPKISKCRRRTTLKKRLLADSQTRDENDALETEFAIARELIAARIRAGLSQAEVAERMGTSQSTIARLESGRTLPSLRTLERYASATGNRTVVRLEAQR